MVARRPRGRPRHPDRFTPAEWRTLHFVRHGSSNRDIARRLGISLDAVKYHVGNLVLKAGVGGRSGLKNLVAVPKTGALGARKVTTMTESVKFSAIGQISRTVTNIEESTRFYAEVLGLEHLYTFGNLAFFDCGGTRLFLEQRDEAGSESIVYFSVSDIHDSHRTLTEKGVSFSGAPHLIHTHADGTEEWMAFFSDLEGRPLALMCQVPVSKE